MIIWYKFNFSFSEENLRKKISEFISIAENKFCKYLIIDILFIAKFESFWRNDNISGIFCSKFFEIIIIFLFFRALKSCNNDSEKEAFVLFE